MRWGGVSDGGKGRVRGVVCVWFGPSWWVVGWRLLFFGFVGVVVTSFQVAVWVSY